MKKKIMVDMDDVICSGGFLYLINEFTHEHYLADDFKNYFMQDIIKTEDKENWIKFFEKHNMYTHAKLLDDVYEVLEKLNEKYEIFIVTAYIMKDDVAISGKVVKDKFEWLSKKLPFISPYNYVFASNKEVIDCDIKIDDRLSNLTGSAKTKLLVTAYHNKDITDEELKAHGAQRVNGWKDIEKILL